MLGHPVDVVSAGPVSGSRGPLPADPVSTGYAAVLAEVLGLETVDPDAHVFEDLGADSLVMARFCARVRKQPNLPAVSIKDVYAQPTLTRLAAALAAGPSAGPAANPVETRLGAVLADVLQVPSVRPDANVFHDLGADSMVLARFCARVRKLPDLPAVSIKDVYAHPSIGALAAALAPPPVADPVETGLAAVLAEVLQVESVPAGAHVFHDLGADSMSLARFCARVRKRDDLPDVSIKDVYAHPTISSLAVSFAGITGAETSSTAGPAAAAPPVPPRGAAPGPARAGTTEYVLTGLLQLLCLAGYALFAAGLLITSYGVISAAANPVDAYLRTVAVGAVTLVGLGALPILLKWVLIGRWKSEQFPIWGLRYVRFWLVKTLVQRNPLLPFVAGTPMYPVYLRALGAKVGRDVVYLAGVPVATDLLTVGDGTVVRKDVLLSCYRAHDGLIETGPVTLGARVVVGEKSIIDIGTTMEDGAQLGHASSLHAGQVVPAGQSWHGSPGRRTEVDYRLVPDVAVTTRRKVTYSVLKMLGALLVQIPVGIGFLAALLYAFPGLDGLLQPGPLALGSGSFYLGMAALSALLYFGGLLLSLVLATTVPRLFNVFLTPDRVYPVYGFHYSMLRGITRRTNARQLIKITGNSNYVVPLLRALGHDLGRVVQTGANFGEAVKFDSPYLTSVGSGTMVADGLSVMNAEFSSTAFTVSRAAIGGNSFLGNAVAYPAGARTGDDVLLATKVMVPIDGEVRQGVGLLGSPAFEIPRTVMRDATLVGHVRTPEDLSRLVRAKRRHNDRAIALFLLTRWITVYLVTLIITVGLDVNNASGYAWPIALATVLSVWASIVFGALVERAAAGFRRQRPLECSMYDPAFWRHERFWKVALIPAVLNGTPFKNLEWRLLGVRIGRRVFDDGLNMPERTLVTIGDHCTFNAGSIIQCHSQEDGGFKLDRITVGSGVTLGVGSWVHYGVTMGDGSELAADAFLMKGSEVPPGTYWVGNPAEELPQVPAVQSPRTPQLSIPAVSPAPRPVDGVQPLEEGMNPVHEGPDPLAVIPVPRRTGRHRAHGRHGGGDR